MIALAFTQRIGDTWHIVLAGMDANAHFDSLAEGTYFLVCTGRQSEPIDILPIAPTHDALHHSINCPTCYHTMSRVYALNNQPPHADYLHPQQIQLMITPEMVTWDIRRLQPPADSLAQWEPLPAVSKRRTGHRFSAAKPCRPSAGPHTQYRPR